MVGIIKNLFLFQKEPYCAGVTARSHFPHHATALALAPIIASLLTTWGGLQSTVKVREVIMALLSHHHSIPISFYFFLLFFNAAVLSIFKNVKSSVVLVGWGTVDVKLFVWREWFTFGMTSRPQHCFCLFVCHFHLAKIMIDVNVVSWRSPLSFDAGSIQVNIWLKLNLLCLYVSSYNVSQHFNHVKGLVYIICRVVI